MFVNIISLIMNVNIEAFGRRHTICVLNLYSYNGDHFPSNNRRFILKRKCHHFDEIFDGDSTGSCQNDNFPSVPDVQS